MFEYIQPFKYCKCSKMHAWLDYISEPHGIKMIKKLIQKCSKLLIVVWNQGRFLYCFMHIFMHDPSSAQQCLMIHMHALPQSLVGYVLAYLPHYEILLVWHPCIFICRIQLIFFVQLNYTLFLSRWQLMYRLFILLSL